MNFYTRSAFYLGGTALCLCGTLYGADPAVLSVGAAMFGLPIMLRDQPAAPRSEHVDPTGLGRPVTIEDKLRADLMADRIDSIDFALAVDRAPDLDSADPGVARHRAATAQIPDEDALPDLDAPHRPRVTARSEFQIARSEFNGTFKGKRNRAPSLEARMRAHREARDLQAKEVAALKDEFEALSTAIELMKGGAPAVCDASQEG